MIIDCPRSYVCVPSFLPLAWLATNPLHHIPDLWHLEIWHHCTALFPQVITVHWCSIWTINFPLDAPPTQINHHFNQITLSEPTTLFHAPRPLIPISFVCRRLLLITRVPLILPRLFLHNANLNVFIVHLEDPYTKSEDLIAGDCNVHQQLVPV